MIKKGQLEQVIALLRQIDDLRTASTNTALTAGGQIDVSLPLITASVTMSWARLRLAFVDEINTAIGKLKAYGVEVE